MIIIPAIDIKGGKCVRLIQGQADTETVYSDDPIEMAHQWIASGATRLHVVDLDGAFLGHSVHAHLIHRLIQEASIPIQLGGGIDSLDTIKKFMESGADAVIIGSKVVSNPHFLEESLQVYPDQIYVGIDARDGEVMVSGWTQPTKIRAIDLAQRVSAMGASRIIYTDIRRDGMMMGPNFSAIREMARAISIPLIASGGVSRLSDIETLLSLESDGVSGVILGKSLYSGSIDLSQAIRLVRKDSAC